MAVSDQQGLLGPSVRRGKMRSRPTAQPVPQVQLAAVVLPEEMARPLDAPPASHAPMLDCLFAPPKIQEPCFFNAPLLESACPSPKISTSTPSTKTIGRRGGNGCAGGAGINGLPGAPGLATPGAPGGAGPAGIPGKKGKGGCAAGNGICNQAVFR